MATALLEMLSEGGFELDVEHYTPAIEVQASDVTTVHNSSTTPTHAALCFPGSQAHAVAQDVFSALTLLNHVHDTLKLPADASVLDTHARNILCQVVGVHTMDDVRSM